jgi:hypothetical protein
MTLLSSKGDQNSSLRYWLHENWAKYSNSFKLQPFNEIKNYFGVKIALYFAFLGFYTRWLISLSFIGCFVMLYGLNSYETDTYVQEQLQFSKYLKEGGVAPYRRKTYAISRFVA